MGFAVILEARQTKIVSIFSRIYHTIHNQHVITDTHAHITAVMLLLTGAKQYRFVTCHVWAMFPWYALIITTHQTFCPWCSNHTTAHQSADNIPAAQIPQCTASISPNAPFCNRNVHMCAHFCYRIVNLCDICLMRYGICELRLLHIRCI